MTEKVRGWTSREGRRLGRSSFELQASSFEVELVVKGIFLVQTRIMVVKVSHVREWKESIKNERQREKQKDLKRIETKEKDIDSTRRPRPPILSRNPEEARKS